MTEHGPRSMEDRVLKISNTASGKKEAVTFLKQGPVTLYVCGMTVYDDCHLGHARSAIVFDVIRNYLKYKGYAVRYVKNYTDIDDKIIDRARQEGRDWKEISDRYIASYERDMRRLHVRPPNLRPKATEHIPEMVALVRRLMSKGMAYDVDGDVYFKVESFAEYGKLSRQKTDEMITGARVEVDRKKKNPLDFVLWKRAKPGEPSWESPWGAGRPGWHLECSAMAIAHLGETIDLHGGGEDLIFPHHENEIAQSEASTGKPFVSCWIHHGFVTTDREKMSKSLGNFFTVDEIFRKSSQFPEIVIAEVLRFYLLSTHYRSPIDFSDGSLGVAKSGLDRFYVLFQKMDEAAAHPEGHEGQWTEGDPFQSAFEAAMDDDFNTAKAIAVLQTLCSEINHRLSNGDANSALAGCRLIQRLGKTLGLFQIAHRHWRYPTWDIVVKKTPDQHRMAHSGMDAATSTALEEHLSEETIQKLVRDREAARLGKNWGKSDEIRERLARFGVILEDRSDGTTRIKR
ncbi:MAG: cysteine--tRNA ligase [Nitrospiria bacterium]